jgi:hypothetical protein
MDLTNIFKVIEQYGWYSVIIALLVACIYLGAKFIGKKISKLNSGVSEMGDKITEKMSEQNSELITALHSQNDMLITSINNREDRLITYLISSKESDRQSHEEKLTERMSLSNEINHKLRDIMNMTHSKHVSILEFHNSFQNMCGIPFAKYTCTYEWYKPGEVTSKPRWQASPFSGIASVVQDILENKEHIIAYKDTMFFKDTNPGLYQYFTEVDTKSVIYVAMYDNTNVMVGLICIEFDDWIPVSVDIKDLKAQAIELSSLVNLQYRFTK